MTILDAAWNNPDGQAFLARGSKYRSFSSTAEKSLLVKWEGLGFSSIDAALSGVGRKKDKVYFFSGDQYTRFDNTLGKFDSGYPRSIKRNWKNTFSRIDAAWKHHKGKNKYYLAKGSEYVRYTEGKGVDPGYPQKISKNWKGVNFDHIDAVVRGIDEKSGKLYFFSGSQYVRYDIKKGKVDPHFPQPILRHWGLPDSWKPKTKKVTVKLMDVFCRTTEDSGPFGSKDELTVMWGGFFGNNTVKGQWRLDGIDDGDKRFFPSGKRVIFNGNLQENSRVEVMIALWDRDHGGGSALYRNIFNKSIDAAGESDNDELKGVAAAAKAINLSGILEKILGLIDPDDNLGQQLLEETTSTLPDGKKDHTLRFRENGADYKVRIRTEVT